MELSFLVEAHRAIHFARGSLFVQDDNEHGIIIYFVDKDNPIATQCTSYIQRGVNDKFDTLTLFNKIEGPKEKIAFNFFLPNSIPNESKLEFQNLWNTIIGKVMIRDMKKNNLKLKYLIESYSQNQ